MANGGGSPFGPFALAQGIGYPELVYKLNELHKNSLWISSSQPKR